MRRRRGLLLALLAIFVVVLLLILRGCDHRTQCMINLSDLGHVLNSMSDDERRATMKIRGSAMFLAWRKRGRIDEKLLRCPDDPDLRRLDDATRKAYDDVDLSNTPDDLCSYAVRDIERYPLPAGVSVYKEIIACCRCGRDGRSPHHRRDVVNVLFAEGDVQAMFPEELGFAPGEPVVVGPESKSEMLRKVIQRPTR